MVAARQVDRAPYDTIQVLPNALTGDGSVFPFAVPTTRGYILPAWGTHERERRLRDYYRHEQNTLLQGAFAGLAKKVASTPWEISGDNDEETAYFTDLFRQAQFRKGWSEFIKMWVLDWLRQDRGTYIELISPGDPRYEPQFRITGIAVLDSLRCYPTGDPRYPAIYWDRDGAKHIIPAGRVIHAVDMRDTDERYPDRGLCALSRAIAVVQREILMGRYIAAQLDDDPPPGIQTFQNISKEGGWEAALASYLQQQSTDDRPPFGKVIRLFGLDPANPVKVESVPFAVAPKAFNWETYVNVDVKMLANAIGVDPQELWELTSKGLGSEGQGEIQHEKAQGKAIGDIYTTLERSLNDVLPESCEFKFKPKDTQADKNEAENAQAWSGVARELKGQIPDQAITLLLANKVSAIKDVMLDADGNLIKYADADQPTTDQYIGSDNAGLAALAPDAEPGSLAALADDDDAPANANPLSVLKAYAGTRENFAREVTALIRKGLRSQVTRRQFGIQFRALLRRYGLVAFRDGLMDGGVDDPLDDADTAQVLAWLAEQSQYITGLGDEIYQRGFSQDVARQRGEMWANKSLQPIFDAGRMSADKNGLYRWVIDGAREHCRDCLKLHNQVHRLRDWYRRDLLPRGNRLACSGFNCTCRLERTEGKARGRFLS